MKPQIRAIYTGKPCRLGRFGRVAYGDELIMTTTEFAAATSDDENSNRFRRLTQEEKVPADILKEAKAQEEARIKAAGEDPTVQEKAAIAEKNRKEALEKENSHEKNRTLELQHLSKEDLREKVAKIRNSGGTITVSTSASKRELISAILQATDKQ